MKVTPALPPHTGGADGPGLGVGVGPGAGVDGGTVIAIGSPSEIRKNISAKIGPYR